MGTQDQVRIGGAVIGGVMLLWARHAVIGRLLTTGRIVVPRLYPYELIILLFFPLSILSTLVGLAMGNSADYIATDMYKFVFISVVYFAVVVAVRRETATDLYKALLQLALILTVFSVINQISIIGIEGEIRRVTPIFGAYFVLPYFLMVEISKGRDPVFKTSRAVRVLIFLMLFLNIFLSFSRISWFVSAAEIILGLVLAKKLFQVQMSVLSSFTLVAGGLLLLGVTVSVLSPSTFEKVDSTWRLRAELLQNGWDQLSGVFDEQEKASYSLSQKTSEGHDVWSYMKENATGLNYIVGFGNGAEYRALTGSITSRVVSSKGPDFNHNIHNIHNILYSILFRQGVLGLVLVTSFFGLLLYTLYNNWRIAQGINKLLIGAFLLGSFAYILRQLSVFDMFWNPYFVVGLAFIGQIMRQEKSKRIQDKNPAQPKKFDISPPLAKRVRAT